MINKVPFKKAVSTFLDNFVSKDGDPFKGKKLKKVKAFYESDREDEDQAIIALQELVDFVCEDFKVIERENPEVRELTQSDFDRTWLFTDIYMCIYVHRREKKDYPLEIEDGIESIYPLRVDKDGHIIEDMPNPVLEAIVESIKKNPIY